MTSNQIRDMERNIKHIVKDNTDLNEDNLVSLVEQIYPDCPEQDIQFIITTLLKENKMIVIIGENRKLKREIEFYKINIYGGKFYFQSKNGGNCRIVFDPDGGMVYWRNVGSAGNSGYNVEMPVEHNMKVYEKMAHMFVTDERIQKKIDVAAFVKRALLKTEAAPMCRYIVSEYYKIHKEETT